MADVKAGGAWVELTAKDGQLKADLAKAEGHVSAFARNVREQGEKIGQSLTSGFGLALAGVATAAKVAITALAKSVANEGDVYDKMAGRTGIAVEALSAFKYAAERCESSLESVEKSVRKMQKNIDDAAAGGKIAAETFSRLGLDLERMKQLTPEDQFREVARAIGGIADPTEKAALAMAVFGKSGTELLPLLNSGPEGLDSLCQSAENLGLVMSGEQATACATMKDSFDDIADGVRGLKNQLIIGLVPSFTQVAKVIRTVIEGCVSFVQSNQELVRALFNLTSGAGTAVMAIVGISYAFKGLAAAMTLVSAHPVMAILTALAGIGVLIYSEFHQGAEGIREVSHEMEELRAKNLETYKSDAKMLDRLEELAKKQSLSNDEIDESIALVESLQSKYGDLGLSVDQVTGKVTGLTEAQEKLNAAVMAKRKADLAAEIEEKKRNVETLKKQNQDMFHQWIGNKAVLRVDDFADNIEELVVNQETGKVHKFGKENKKEYLARQREIAATEAQIAADENLLENFEPQTKAADAVEAATSGTAGAATAEKGDKGTESLAKLWEEKRREGQTELQNAIEDINKKYDGLESAAADKHAAAIAELEKKKASGRATDADFEAENQRYSAEKGQLGTWRQGEIDAKNAAAQKKADEDAAKIKEDEERRKEAADKEAEAKEKEAAAKERDRAANENTPAEQKLASLEIKLEKALLEYEKARESGDTKKIAAAGKDAEEAYNAVEKQRHEIDVSEMEEARKAVEAAMDELAEAEESGIQDRIDAANKKLTEARSKLASSTTFSATGFESKIKPIAEEMKALFPDPKDLKPPKSPKADAIEKGMAESVKYSSVGTSNPFEIAKLSTNYDKKMIAQGDELNRLARNIYNEIKGGAASTAVFG